jgi:hypothetical protein
VSNRRWKPMEFELDGLKWRVVKGRKSPDDLRLEHMTPRGWRPTAMALLFMLTDFWYENEDLLYPKPRYQGAEYLLRAVRRAAVNGFQSEVEKLNGEKQRKREREATPQLTVAPEPTPPTARVVEPIVCASFTECDNDPTWHCPTCRRHLPNPYVGTCTEHRESA